MSLCAFVCPVFIWKRRLLKHFFSTSFHFLYAENYLNFNNGIWMSFIFRFHDFIHGNNSQQWHYIDCFISLELFRLKALAFCCVFEEKRETKTHANNQKKKFHWLDPFGMSLVLLLLKSTFIFYCFCPWFILPLHFVFPVCLSSRYTDTHEQTNASKPRVM